jgi:hypothetical protein
LDFVTSIKTYNHIIRRNAFAIESGKKINLSRLNYIKKVFDSVIKKYWKSLI